MRTPDNRLGSTPTTGQLRAAEKNEAAAYDPPIQEVRVSPPTALPSDPSQKERALTAREQPSIQSRSEVVKYKFPRGLAIRRTPHSSR
jgi:hypothetical protein